MLDVGLGVRLIVAAAHAPPVPAPRGKPPFPLSSSFLRRRCSSWWFSNGSAHGRDTTTTTTSSRAARRRWWLDFDHDGSQEDYGSSSLEEDDYDYVAAFSGFGWAEQLFDESWFSKVSKTYGVILPVMLVSMFAATGLKAFLMAMAIPLSQSAISSLLRRRKGNRGDKWRRPFQDVKHNYQSWVSKDFADAASTAAVGADDNTKSSRSGYGGGNKSSGRYGGWDELLDSNSFSAGNTDYYSTKSRPSASRRRGAPPERMRMRRRLRLPRTLGLGSTRYKQAPPLMHLLVAVFPFLGSWFRLL